MQSIYCGKNTDCLAAVPTSVFTHKVTIIKTFQLADLPDITSFVWATSKKR